jgi:H+-transporting ATPase
MSFLRQRNGHGPPEDDVEANAAGGSNGENTEATATARDDDHIKFPGHLPTPRPSHGRASGDLPEYEALDRYITNYDAERRASMVSSAEKGRKRKKWWQFWKSSPAEHDDEHPVKDEGKAPDSWLNAHIKEGIPSSVVEERRKRFGWNELTAEKEDMLEKIFGYFRGPILYSLLSPTIMPLSTLTVEQFTKRTVSYGTRRFVGCRSRRLD